MGYKLKQVEAGRTAVTEAPAAEVRGRYLSRYENAKYWQDYTDFAYYRLEVSGVYFIGGFGVMGWVSTEYVAIAAQKRAAHRTTP